MKQEADHWNEKYELPIDAIPWEIDTPPRDLTAALTEYEMAAGACALDVACGTGNYSRYLASRGFHVTAIDFSANALAIATSRQSIDAQAIQYIEGDVTKLSSLLPAGQRFDFILDYSFSHHLAPEAFVAYVRQFGPILKETGKLLVVCYSPKDPYARGRQSAQGLFGNTMFYRTKECIEAAYKPLKVDSYASTTLGKANHHRGHRFLFAH